MRVACSRCQTKYDVPEDKVAQAAVKVRCSECGNVFVVRKRATPTAAEPSPEESSAGEASAEAAPDTAPAEAQFDDFDFAALEGAEADAAAPEPDVPGEPELPDLDDLPDAAAAPAADAAIPLADAPEPADLTGDEDLGDLDDNLSAIGELDLGDFEDLDQDLSGLDDLDLGEAGDDLAFPEEHHGAELDEPMERVKEEDLLGAQPQDAPVQSLAEDMPRLDIQRGPRRAEGSSPSPVLARDRRHSPLLWLVVVVAVATLGFTGFMLYTQRDAAFTFLSIEKIRALWQRHSVSQDLDAVDQQGFYKDLPAGRQVFVIQGAVVNRSQMTQSSIKIRGELYAASGETVASHEVYCGNVLNEHELASLPAETVEARLQNEVGEGLSNVDIAPGASVPFMVVFSTPPDGVEKFNVTVIPAQTGAGN